MIVPEQIKSAQRATIPQLRVLANSQIKHSGHTDQFRFGGDIKLNAKAVAAISDRENVLHKVHRAFVNAGKICLVHIQLFEAQARISHGHSNGC